MTENMAQDLLNENFRRRLKTVCQRILLPAKLSDGNKVIISTKNKQISLTVE